MVAVTFTPVNEIPSVVAEARKAFASKKTLPAEYRKQQLRALHLLISENKDAIIHALKQDLAKPTNEAAFADVTLTLNEISEAVHELDKWMAAEKPSVDLLNVLDGCKVLKQPLGTVLIIGAWNFPFNLTLAPLAGAIAAGCTAVIKPSEIAANSAELLAQLFPKYLDNAAYKVVNGAVAETTKLLEQKWDHIFYTGNGTVGRIIMGAAAKQLCPVTLELGGKSPTIIDKTSDLYVTARRLVYCKYFNAGQICIAPDYVILLDGVDEAKFLAQVKAAVLEFYGEDPKNSTSFARIINGNHFNRLKPLLASGTVAIGGQTDEATKYIAPTVLTDVSPDSLVMKDEIFGPILPIIKQKTLDDAIDFINSRDRPLALYYFSNDTAALKKVGNETTSGAYVTNDCVMHFTVASLPFGGVGPSGMGAYHSKRSFDTFTHSKATMFKDQNLEIVNNIRYPPYTDGKGKTVTALFSKALDPFPVKKILNILIAIAAFVVGVTVQPTFFGNILKAIGLN